MLISSFEIQIDDGLQGRAGGGIAQTVRQGLMPGVIFGFQADQHDGGGCKQRDIHMIRDAALLIGLGLLLTVGYWGALGWAIWWAI
jgi:hypothetical protein